MSKIRKHVFHLFNLFSVHVLCPRDDSRGPLYFILSVCTSVCLFVSPSHLKSLYNHLFFTVFKESVWNLAQMLRAWCRCASLFFGRKKTFWQNYSFFKFIIVFEKWLLQGVKFVKSTTTTVFEQTIWNMAEIFRHGVIVHLPFFGGSKKYVWQN